jgi:hypothetical protein
MALPALVVAAPSASVHAHAIRNRHGNCKQKDALHATACTRTNAGCHFVMLQVRIALHGCSVTVVTECLQGKSLWWQKGPLLISHPTRTLLQGETAFYLFAEHSAAKEQWLLALQWASSSYNQQQPQQQAHGLYATFCRQMRAAFAAQRQEQPAQAAATCSRSCQPQVQHQRLQQQQQHNTAAAVQDGGPQASSASADFSSALQLAEDCVVGLSLSSGGTSKAAAKQSLPEKSKPDMESVCQNPPAAEHSVSPAACNKSTSQQQQSQQQPGMLSAAATAAEAAASASSVDTNLYGLNVLLSRVTFELLQSSEFAGKLGGALQQWLDGMRRPAYLDR